MTDALPTKNQLHWQCRRGLLELDYLFDEFLQEHYAQLEDRLKQDFVTLLGYNDQDLQHWLLYDEAPADASMTEIIAAVRRSKLG